MNSRRSAFSLVELLATVAIIAVLSSLLVIGIQKARSGADSAKCVSNLRTSGNAILQYFQDNGTELFPSQNWFTYPSTKAKPNSGMLDYFWPGPVGASDSANSDKRYWQDTMLTCPAMKRKYPQYYPQALNWSYAINYYLLQKDPSPSYNSLPSAQRPPLAGAPQRTVNVPRPSTMWILTEAPVNGATLSYLNDYTAAHPGNFMSLPHNEHQNVCFFDGHVESLDRQAFVKPPNPRAFWGNLNMSETQALP